jgi:hypothetical protein
VETDWHFFKSELQGTSLWMNRFHVYINKYWCSPR